MRGTIWYLLIWAAFFAASQIVRRFSGGAANIAMAAMIASAGLSVDNTLGLISRAQSAASLQRCRTKAFEIYPREVR